MKFFKRLPPPPAGPEPFVSTAVDKITLTNNVVYLLHAPHIGDHLDGKYISGHQVDERNSFTMDAVTTIPFVLVSERCRMKFSPWRNRLVESDEPLWSAQ